MGQGRQKYIFLEYIKYGMKIGKYSEWLEGSSILNKGLVATNLMFMMIEIYWSYIMIKQNQGCLINCFINYVWIELSDRTLRQECIVSWNCSYFFHRLFFFLVFFIKGQFWIKLRILCFGLKQHSIQEKICNRDTMILSNNGPFIRNYLSSHFWK